MSGSPPLAFGAPPALRPLTFWDVATASAIHAVCFPEDPWWPLAISTLLASPGNFGLIALATDLPEPQPLGFVMARAVADEGEILTIGCRSEARQRGVGRLLLDAAIAQAAQAGARTMYLEVAEDNEPARRLYGAAGFEFIGRRPGYYRRVQGAVAALVLKRSLQDPDPVISRTSQPTI
ncbi:MAG: GNAT family N-acetyltransferase [Azospirillaceae bacterium]|nr:GNAT family N-acetyltransferase [Azospirillaceae bacterium]